MKTAFIKNNFGLLSLFLGLMALFIFWAQNASQKGLFFSNADSKIEIESLITQFQNEFKPTAEINFSEIYGNSGQFQILHPLLSFKKLHISNCKNCSEKQIEAEEQQSLLQLEKEKRKQVEAFISGASPLPQDFFLKPPFADQQGSSYAYLISMYPGLLGDQTQWLEEHLSYFKISELKEVLEKYKIRDPKFLILSQFKESEIESVIRGEELILTESYFLVKDQDRLGFSPLSYNVFSTTEFDQFIKNGKFEINVEQAGSLCLAKIGNTCWTYNSLQTQAYFFRYSFVILVLLGLFLAGVFGIYIKNLFEKNKAQIKNRLSLQVLSHEFRTPVSSMLLMMEQLSQRQSQFDAETHDLLIRLSTEIYRMQRIIEVSKTYLQTEGHQIPFKKIEVPSINQWLADFIHELPPEQKDQLRFESLIEDCELVIDHFWYNFIVMNLVQNAFVHGEAPVTLKLKKERAYLRLSIQDLGKNEFDSLDQMTEAFVKSSRSKGMGLGLNMILFVVDQWGAKLQFEKDPTTFSLLWPVQGKK